MNSLRNLLNSISDSPQRGKDFCEFSGVSVPRKESTKNQPKIRGKSEQFKEGCSMDQYLSRLKLSENCERPWSIRISPGPIIGPYEILGNSYGPMVLKVLLKFPPTLVLVHGWLFPAI